jgi:hypothetical protein
MLKKPASFVFVSLNASTTKKHASAYRPLGPCRTVVLNILQVLIEGAHSRQVLVVKTRATIQRPLWTVIVMGLYHDIPLP